MEGERWKERERKSDIARKNKKDRARDQRREKTGIERERERERVRKKQESERERETVAEGRCKHRLFRPAVAPCWQIAAQLLIELADNAVGLLSIACMGGRLRECKYIIRSQMPLCCRR